jgi:hypothetical protein
MNIKGLAVSVLGPVALAAGCAANPPATVAELEADDEAIVVEESGARMRGVCAVAQMRRVTGTRVPTRCFRVDIYTEYREDGSREFQCPPTDLGCRPVRDDLR